eukprot:55144_1
MGSAKSKTKQKPSADNQNENTRKTYQDIQQEKQQRFLNDPPTPLILHGRWTKDHENALNESLQKYELNKHIASIIIDCIGIYQLTSIIYDIDKYYIDSLKSDPKIQDKDDFKIFVSGTEQCGKTTLLDTIIGKQTKGVNKLPTDEFIDKSDIINNYKKRIGFKAENKWFKWMEEEAFHMSTSDMIYETDCRKQSDIVINVFMYKKGKYIPYHSTECGIIVRNVFENEDNIKDEQYYRKLQEICKKWHNPYIEVNAKNGENMDILIQQMLVQFMYYG